MQLVPIPTVWGHLNRFDIRLSFLLLQRTAESECSSNPFRYNSITISISAGWGIGFRDMKNHWSLCSLLHGYLRKGFGISTLQYLRKVQRYIQNNRQQQDNDWDFVMQEIQVNTEKVFAKSTG